MSFAGNTPNAQRADTHEFLAIEMIDRKIRFSWNVGAGTQHITHNVTLETAFGTGLGIASQVLCVLVLNKRALYVRHDFI